MSRAVRTALAVAVAVSLSASVLPLPAHAVGVFKLGNYLEIIVR